MIEQETLLEDVNPVNGWLDLLSNTTIFPQKRIQS